jgi:hypothetical protein
MTQAVEVPMPGAAEVDEKRASAYGVSSSSMSRLWCAMYRSLRAEYTPKMEP